MGALRQVLFRSVLGREERRQNYYKKTNFETCINVTNKEKSL